MRTPVARAKNRLETDNIIIILLIIVTSGLVNASHFAKTVFFLTFLPLLSEIVVYF